MKLLLTSGGIKNNSIRTIEGVRSTETFVYLELSKQTYTWGTR